jgi:CBS domain-containing protein
MQKAKDIMHQHTFIPADMPVNEVAALMSQKRIGSVLVKTKDGIGILTERDITGKIVASAKDPKTVKASDIMTHPVTTIDAGTELYEICRIFNENKFRRLPVIEGGEVVGVLTTRDVVKQFIPRFFKEMYHFKDFRF